MERFHHLWCKGLAFGETPRLRRQLPIELAIRATIQSASLAVEPALNLCSDRAGCCIYVQGDMSPLQ